jgi:hypothetical protein
MFSRGLAGERLVNSPDPEIRRLYSMWSGTQKEWAENGFDMDFVSDPKSWRGESPLVYHNPGSYKQADVGSDGFGGSSEGRQR